MPEVSIKFRKNGTRGNTAPGECINLRSPLSPDGAEGVKFGTNAQGGDGSLELSIADRGPEGNWPAKKNDAAEVYYGLERVSQHSIMEVKRDEMEGTLQFACQGHHPHYAKGYLLGYTTPQAIWVSQVLQSVVSGGWAAWPAHGWIPFGAPFINSSYQYFGVPAFDDSNVVVGYPAPSPNGETVISDMLALSDFIAGIFPGREASPDGLGCYFYARHRTAGQTVKWYIEQEDMARIPGGGFQVELDWSMYCNRVLAYYKDGSGVTQVVAVQDDPEIAKRTPGTRDEAVVDLTSILPNQSTTTAATAAATAYLNIFKKPQPKGSIILPLQNIRSKAGMRWSGLIRGGDVVKIERDEYRAFDESDPIDNFNGFFIDSTMVDIDAGIITLNMPNPSTLEAILANSLAA